MLWQLRLRCVELVRPAAVKALAPPCGGHGGGQNWCPTPSPQHPPAPRPPPRGKRRRQQEPPRPQNATPGEPAREGRGSQKKAKPAQHFPTHPATFFLSSRNPKSFQMRSRALFLSKIIRGEKVFECLRRGKTDNGIKADAPPKGLHKAGAFTQKPARLRSGHLGSVGRRAVAKKKTSQESLFRNVWWGECHHKGNCEETGGKITEATGSYAAEILYGHRKRLGMQE